MGGAPKPAKPASKSDEEVQQAAADERRGWRLATSRKRYDLTSLYGKTTFGG